jgi:cytosine deaminase
MDLVIKNARVADDRPSIDVGIENGVITALEPRLDVPAARVIDAGDRVVVPGFCEPHLHLDKALLHRRLPASEGTLQEAIRLTGELKAVQTREDVLDRSRTVLDMAVRNGTVSIRAQPDVDPIQGLLGVETAATLRDEYRGLVDLQIVAFPQEGIVKAPGTYELMQEAMRCGADVVGGCSYNEASWDDTVRHIDSVFELAQRFDAPVDIHADFGDDVSDRRYAAAHYIAERAIALGYQGRVSLGHVTSLGSLTPDEARPAVEKLAEADVQIVALPATDLYLGGRTGARNQHRGLTPVRQLREAGVNVTFSSNNVRNAFTPFGKADVLQIASLLAHVAQLGTASGQAEVLRMATYDAARAMGMASSYGLAVGCRADLVVLDTALIADVLLDLPPRLWVVKDGRVSVETRHECTVHPVEEKQGERL